MNCKLKTAIFLAGTITFSMVAASASASAIYSFSGTITSSGTTGAAPTDLVNEGDTIDGTLIYNPDVLSDGYLDDPSNVSGAPILYASLSNGRASWGTAFGIDDLEAGSGFAGYNVHSGSLKDGGLQVANHDDQQAILALAGVAEWTPPTSYPANGFELPAALNLNNFSGGEFEWEFFFPDFNADSGDQLFIEGTIGQIARVSEPGSLALLALGMAVLARKRKPVA
jgi:hypothetical protein